jgi:RimJ/RimL family protein N-acetyltransferase
LTPIDQLSLGWRTDLIFPRFDAQVIARRDHLLVRTPHNPTFWWGNFLLFDRVPVDGDAAPWLAHFDAEIASRQPESRHVAFGVDSSEPFDMPADLLDAGFTRHAGTVLTLRREQLRAPPMALAASFRFAVLALPAQASAVVEQQVASDAGEHQPVAEYRLFRERQMQRYGAMQRAGLGGWFGVFARTAQGEQLVADCGLFRDDVGVQALGRFQFVSTHPAWRRRGLCRALIHAVCRHGFEVMALHTLVIVADPDDVAIGLYESLGFERGANTWHLERRPDAARA